MTAVFTKVLGEELLVSVLTWSLMCRSDAARRLLTDGKTDAWVYGSSILVVTSSDHFGWCVDNVLLMFQFTKSGASEVSRMSSYVLMGLGGECSFGRCDFVNTSI